MQNQSLTNMKKQLVLASLALLLTCQLAQAQALKQMAKQAAMSALLTQLQANPKFSKFATLFQAAQAAGLLGQPQGAFTLLAPTNEAIDAGLSATQFQNLLKPTGRGMLGNLVKRHLISGALDKAGLGGGKGPTNLLGQALALGKGGNQGLSLGGANLLDSDIKAGDSFIHGIDRLLPQ
jgi:uncharacterized surface protein with fasciclin (FAS1) repeats